MDSLYKKQTGWRRIVAAAGHSLAGFSHAYRSESAFRQEVWICLPAVLLAPLIGKSWTETALLVGSAMLVLIIELLNSSIESAVDRISLEWHELAKRAKDMASAAVLTSLTLFVGLWLTAIVRWIVDHQYVLP